MTDYFTKRGDTAPPLRATLYQANGNPLDLTGATVQFLLRRPGASAPQVDRAASIIAPPSGGVVEYQWQSGDLNEAGEYWAEFRATLPGGALATIPKEGYIIVRVQEGLG